MYIYASHYMAEGTLQFCGESPACSIDGVEKAASLFGKKIKQDPYLSPSELKI